jgi:hypothetical protein
MVDLTSSCHAARASGSDRQRPTRCAGRIGVDVLGLLTLTDPVKWGKTRRERATVLSKSAQTRRDGRRTRTQWRIP